MASEHTPQSRQGNHVKVGKLLTNDRVKKFDDKSNNSGRFNQNLNDTVSEISRGLALKSSQQRKRVDNRSNTPLGKALNEEKRVAMSSY